MLPMYLLIGLPLEKSRKDCCGFLRPILISIYRSELALGQVQNLTKKTFFDSIHLCFVNMTIGWMLSMFQNHPIFFQWRFLVLSGVNVVNMKERCWILEPNIRTLQNRLKIWTLQNGLKISALSCPSSKEKATGIFYGSTAECQTTNVERPNVERLNVKLSKKPQMSNDQMTNFLNVECYFRAIWPNLT
jgi:hypothetical protein